MESIPKESSNEFVTTVKHLIAGGIAGAVSRTCVSPFERLKILYQVQGANKSAPYGGVIKSFIKIRIEEGYIGFFKGNGANVIRIIPYSAVQFTVFDWLKKLIMEHNEAELNSSQRLFSGALAGIASVTFTYPLDLIRTRLSVQTNYQDKGIVNALMNIVMKEGVVALYKGIFPTIMGVAPYVGLNFMIYETLKASIRKHVQPDPSIVQLLCCGGISGTVAQTITYPLDVLRRKMQIQGFTPDHPIYGTTWNAVKHIWKTDSYRGFYRGLIPNYLKVAPSISISFVVYEYFKKQLGG